MADEYISQLTQIAAPTGTPPYPTAFTNPSTGAMLEILDTTNTSMAPSGTNSAIAPGHLLKGFLAAGSNVTLSETSGIVTIAASGGVTSTYFSNVMTGGPYSTVSTSYSNVTNASITVSTPGTYMLFALVSAQINWGQPTALGQENDVNVQMWDTNAAAVVPGFTGLKAAFVVSQQDTASLFGGQTATFGPFIVSPAASNLYQLQFALGGNVGTNPYAYITACTITAIRIA